MIERRCKLYTLVENRAAYEKPTFYTSLIGSDGSALDTNTILEDSFGSFVSDLIIGLISVFEACMRICATISFLPWQKLHSDESQNTTARTKIVVLDVQVKVWEDELQFKE
jgi:hypothetical protein